MDIVDEDFIKKSKINYIKCTEGELHDGELMNFVCVETKCPKKGLICPVCRMNEHEQHKIIPLKIFLNEVRNRFLSQTNESELTGLSDYLRILDNTKKSLLGLLKDTVMQIAEKVKAVESKIVDNYNNLRRMVLTQSTISTKLPGLITLMLETGERDPRELQAEFQKYAQLLRYEDNKLNFFDSSRKIVEEYSNLPGTISAHLTTLIPELSKIFDSLPLSVDQIKSTKPAPVNYNFSEADKPLDIAVAADKKTVSMNLDEYDMGGYVSVSEGLNVQHQAIALKILNNSSGSICIGMANIDILKTKGYRFDEVDQNHGCYTISAMGVTFQHNDVDKQANDQSFVFSTGDIIEIEWQAKNKKITFSRRNGVEKFVMDVKGTDAELGKLLFVVGLFGEEDKVQIVE